MSLELKLGSPSGTPHQPRHVTTTCRARHL
jgi:hypothetical protein